jgi:hypothetical protein
MQTTAHPGDDILLLAMDGALPRRRQARIDTHVAACGACRGRPLLVSTLGREPFGPQETRCRRPVLA